MILQTYGKEIVSLAVPLLAWGLNTFFKGKAKLLVARQHGFTFLVSEPLLDAQGNLISPTQTMATGSFVISNPGREPATKIELVFNWKPKCINLWPARHYDDRIESDNRYTMTISNLAPREDLGIEIFSINNDLPELVVARCEQCVAQSIFMAPQPVVPAWKRRVAVFLLFAGLATVIYASIVLLQFLILRTPLGH